MDDHHAEAITPPGPEERRRRRLFGFWLVGTWRGRSLLSVLALSAIGAAGLLVTGAVLTDEVTMATVTTTGGTLDLVANSDTTDTGVAWDSTSAPAGQKLSVLADVSNMKPGDTAYGDVVLDNAGSLPFTMTLTQTGSDTHPNDANHCFSFYFRQIAGAVGATKDAALPKNITGMGTDETTDVGTTLFEPAPAVSRTATMFDVTDDPATVPNESDTVWEVDDNKTYRLHVRMRTECEQGGDPDGNLTSGTPTAATGTLNFRFDVTQA